MDPQLIQNLIVDVVLAFIGFVAFTARGLVQVGIEYLRAKVGDRNFDSLLSYADMTVRFIEQSPAFQELDGDKKKELAIVELLKFCEQNKLPVDRALIDKTIESAVQIMNAEKGKIEMPAVPLPGTTPFTRASGA
jgi:hypothetical protein